MQIQRVAEQGQRDPDLLATSERVGGVDAAAIALRAHPLDPEKSRAVSARLRAAARGAAVGAPERKAEQS